MPDFPNRLARLRTAQGLTATQLAAQRDRHTHTVTRWEQGHAIPQRYWAQLSEMFGVSVAYLLGLDDGDGGGKEEAA